MSQDLYQEIIIDLYQHPHHKGQVENPDVTFHERNSSCGDEVTVTLKIDTTQQKITELKWSGDGCAISMATIDLLAEKINAELLTFEDIKKITKKNLEEMLGIEEIAYGREKCLLLGLETVQKAVEKM
jgi:nitrogen fixation NifU-like protein